MIRRGKRLPETPPELSPMLELEQSADSFLLKGDHYELGFRYVRDRWRHALMWRAVQETRPILSSVEGGEQDVLPPSPAIQDLRVEKLGAEVFEFQGMGQAGGAIYSTAIRCDGSSGEISFDFCARGRRPDSSIAAVSTYDLADDWGVVSSARTSVDPLQLQARTDHIRMEPFPVEGQPAVELRVEEGCGGSRIVAGYSIAMSCDNASRPRSLRWRYRVRLNGLP